jgi:hypothetical protein
LEKSKGQAKAMMSSWVVSSTESSDVDMLSSNMDYNMGNNTVNETQRADSPHNWVFSGMFGFKKNGRRR